MNNFRSLSIIIQGGSFFASKQAWYVVQAKSNDRLMGGKDHEDEIENGEK